MIAPNYSTVRNLFDNVYRTKKRRVSPRTIRKMLHELNRWERLSGDPPAAEITGATFDAFRDAGVAAGLAGKTLECNIGTILTVLRFAHKKGHLSALPDEGERLPQGSPRRPVPTVQDLDSAYRHADAAQWPRLGDLPPGDFWRAWLVTSYFTGLRLSDMMHGLLWDNLTDDSLAVDADKTGKRHIFPVPSTLRRHVDLLRGVDSYRIFPVTKSPHRIRWSLELISMAAGVSPKLGPQGLRRLAATEWQKSRWGSGQLLLGHSLGSCSDRYIAPILLQEAVKTLEIPPSFLTEEERDTHVDDLADKLKSLDPESRAALAKLLGEI